MFYIGIQQEMHTGHLCKESVLFVYIHISIISIVHKATVAICGYRTKKTQQKLDKCNENQNND